MSVSIYGWKTCPSSKSDQVLSLLSNLFLKNFFGRGGDEAKKIHWVKWERVCKPKEEGGLGIKDLKLFNIALIKIYFLYIDCVSNETTLSLYL
jgi:N-acetyl-beta-hexosaminidase